MQIITVVNYYVGSNTTYIKPQAKGQGWLVATPHLLTNGYNVRILQYA